MKIFFFCLLTFAFGLGAFAPPVPMGFFAAPPAAPPSGPAYLSGAELTGLIAYYRHDAGAGNNEPDRVGIATLYASNAPSTTVGIITNARVCGGGGGSYFTSTHALFNRPGQDWTWTAWLKANTVNTTHFVITKYDGDLPGSQFFLYRDPAMAGKLSFHLIEEYEDEGTVYVENALDDDAGMVTNAWYFIAFGVAGGEMFLSVNGAEPSTLALSYGMHAGAEPRLVVGNFDGGSNHYDGIIDEQGYYDAGLSAATIASLYNSGAGKTISP